MVFKRFCLLIDFKRFHHLIRSVQIHLGLVKLNRPNRLELEELLKPLIKLVEDGANLIQPSAILSFQLLHIALQLLGLFLVHTFNGADPVSLEYEIFLAFKGGREQASVRKSLTESMLASAPQFSVVACNAHSGGGGTQSRYRE